MKLFRKQREKTLKSRNITQYLLYALSEVFLVVIGILIAVYFNNRNQQAKDAVELENILSIIQKDIKNDIQEAKDVIQSEEAKYEFYSRFFSGKLTKKEYVFDIRIRRLIFGYKEISFDRRGYELLKDFKNSVEVSQDTLIVQIVHLYSDRVEEVEADDQLRKFDFELNYSFWKTQKWWADYLRNIPNNDFIEYALNDQDYKNRVASWHFITYTAFLPELKRFIKEGERILQHIEENNTEVKTSK